MRISDWSSDVCSSDLALFAGERLRFPKELKDDDAGHDEGRHLTLACYGMLPATRITDVLSQVERWTGFTQHFGHVSTGLPPGDEQAFLATLIAEATNLGLSRMAEVCGAGRSEERRVGNEWVSTCRSRLGAANLKKKKQ